MEHGRENIASDANANGRRESLDRRARVSVHRASGLVQTRIANFHGWNPHRFVTAGRIFPSVRHPQRYHPVAVATIDSEIAIEREHLGGGVDFRKPDQAGVRQ